MSPADTTAIRRSRSYRFPASIPRTYADGACREFPLWCLAISVPRSRA